MRITPASISEWESLVREDPAATIFQTPVWHGLAESCEGSRSHPLLFNFGKEKAILPLQASSRWWGTRHGAPFGTYTALISPSQLDPSRLRAIVRELRKLNIDIPGSPFARNSLTDESSTASQTRVLRLEKFQPGDWLQSWSRNHRRCLRTAQETGFKIRFAETSGDVARYDEVYRGQVERWGGATRRTYPEALFQEAFLRMGRNGSLRLWLAEADGRIVAGRLCLYHGFHAVEWHAAAERTAMEQGVNHLLVHAIVLHAHEAGFRIYDFNPNPGLQAVDHFKRGFGTEELEFKGIRNGAGFTALARALINSWNGFFKSDR